MGCTCLLGSPELLTFFKDLTIDRLAFPDGLLPIDLSPYSWIDHVSDFEDKTRPEILRAIVIACLHHRFFVIGGRFPSDGTGLPFEFYNPSLFARQLSLSQMIPHSHLYFPVNLYHIGDEVRKGRFSKATVELIVSLPKYFLNPTIKASHSEIESFQAWWLDRYRSLTRGVPSFSGAPKKRKLEEIVQTSTSFGLKKMVTKAVKTSKNTKPSVQISKSTKPPVQTVHKHKRYSTRSSSHLVTRESDTVSSESDDCISGDSNDHSHSGDMVTGSSDHISHSPEPNPMDTTAFGHNSPQPSRQDAEIVAPSPPLNFSSRRAKLLAIGSHEKADLIFMDCENPPNTPGSIQPVESLAQARNTVLIFLKMGLLHFGETQRAAMLSAASLLRTSPDLSDTKLDRLLKDVPSLISRSEAARVSSSEMFQTLNSSRAKRIKKDELDRQDQALYDQLVQVAAAFDADEAAVQRLEEMKKKIDEDIEQYKVKMAAHLETGESLGRSLSVVRDDSHSLGQELASQKDEYATWIKNLQEAEKAQSDCLAQWEKLRDILTGCSNVAGR